MQGIEPLAAMTITLCRRCHTVFHGHKKWVVRSERTRVRRAVYDALTAKEYAWVVSVAGVDYLKRIYR